MKEEGVFIVVEGPDGTGKDTLIKGLQETLQDAGIHSVAVKDPSPKTASSIRKIVLNENLSDTARLHLFLAARAELVEKEIKPALEAGHIVFCNRFTLSTLAYQGLHFDVLDILKMHHLSGLDLVPDLELVLLSENSFKDAEENLMDSFCRQNREQIYRNYVDYSLLRQNCHLIDIDDCSETEVLVTALRYVCSVIL